MKSLTLFFLFCVSPLLAVQPPYEVEDPAISENFRQIYLDMDQHRHNDDGSSRMYSVIPDSATTYDLGASSRVWKNAYIALPNYTSGQLRLIAPPRTGYVIFNSDALDLYVATGTATAAWKNTRTGGSP